MFLGVVDPFATFTNLNFRPQKFAWYKVHSFFADGQLRIYIEKKNKKTDNCDRSELSGLFNDTDFLYIVCSMTQIFYIYVKDRFKTQKVFEPCRLI